MFVSVLHFLGTPKLTGIPLLKVSINTTLVDEFICAVGPSIDETRQKIESSVTLK